MIQSLYELFGREISGQNAKRMATDIARTDHTCSFSAFARTARYCEQVMKEIGLSEVGADTIRRAHAVHPIVDLQIEYALVSRGPERAIFPVLAELGIGVTAYGVLSRGLLAGSKPQDPNDFRTYLPRFAGANGEKNAAVVETLQALAAARGVTVAQLCVAWVLAKQQAAGTRIVPVMGARTRAQLDDALGAIALKLSAEDIAAIESAVPADAIAGSRYPDAMLKHMDSER